MSEHHNPNYLRDLMAGDWRQQERLESLQRQNEREREAREARYKRDREAQEAFERAQEAAAEKKRKEIDAERRQYAEEQTAKDKERLKRDYQMAGGDPALWESFWKEEAPKIIAKRIADREKNVARPGRDY